MMRLEPTGTLVASSSGDNVVTVGLVLSAVVKLHVVVEAIPA